jgi:ferredoxin
VKALALETEDTGTCVRRCAVVDESLCIGCGVCSASCSRKALLLRKRSQRVYLPEDTLERVIIASLERGTLQNLIFDNPNRVTHEYLRSFLGAFLRLSPVKKALVSETFRSRFLSVVR